MFSRNDCRIRREEYLTASCRTALLPSRPKWIRDSLRRLLQSCEFGIVGGPPLINTQLQLGEGLAATAQTVSTVSSQDL
jgi:hypothetical protein